MACDARARAAWERQRREAALKALSAALAAGTARIVRRGSVVSIEGWADRAGWCDECAVRALRMSGDFRARQMIAAALAAGTDRGITFGHGH